MKNRSVVLAFSGGLDTSYCLYELRRQGFDVHTVFVDTGGVSDDERNYIEQRARDLGAARHWSVDAGQDLWDEFVIPLVWSGALAGVLFKSLAIGKAPIASVAIYVALGWSIVLAYGPLVRAMSPGGLRLLVAGGCAYTLGLTFYAWKSLRYHHLVWHLFVLAGSILHFFAVLADAIPDPVLRAG